MKIKRLMISAIASKTIGVPYERWVGDVVKTTAKYYMVEVSPDVKLVRVPKSSLNKVVETRVFHTYMIDIDVDDCDLEDSYAKLKKALRDDIEPKYLQFKKAMEALGDVDV